MSFTNYGCVCICVLESVYMYKMYYFWGFPGGAVVESPPADAGDHGFVPWSGQIPHAAERLAPWAMAAESARPEPVLRNGRGHNSERPTHRDEGWPPLASIRESPRTETKTQHSHK